MKHRSFSFVGGYPLVHVTRLQVPLCASCADKRAADPLEDDKPTVSAPNCENDNLSCEDCDRRIPSAYGAPAEDTFFGYGLAAREAN